MYHQTNYIEYGWSCFDQCTYCTSFSVLKCCNTHFCLSFENDSSPGLQIAGTTITLQRVTRNRAPFEICLKLILLLHHVNFAGQIRIFPEYSIQSIYMQYVNKRIFYLCVSIKFSKPPEKLWFSSQQVFGTRVSPKVYASLHMIVFYCAVIRWLLYYDPPPYMNVPKQTGTFWPLLMQHLSYLISGLSVLHGATARAKPLASPVCIGSELTCPGSHLLWFWLHLWRFTRTRFRDWTTKTII